MPATSVMCSSLALVESSEGDISKCASPNSPIEELMRASKTSQNVTESVPVPSSEHVAEIVGRQGCKIKALRAKTNTYIKTPIRGETPMFVITGRKEDVQTAKREIQLAADHFSQIRARRGSGSSSNSSTQLISPRQTAPPSPKLPLSSSSSSSTSPSSNISESVTELTRNVPQICATLLPGQVIKKVTVPYQVVGLVVGPKGSTIKRIQQNTCTYIVTPSRDSQPVFEIQGMPDNVEAAKAEIENYIMLRTTQPQSQTTTSSTYSPPSSSSNSIDYNFDLEFSNLSISQKTSNQMSAFNNQMTSLLNDDAFNHSIWCGEDLLVNSIQQAINTVRSTSSSSSSSSSTSSSFSLSNKINADEPFNLLDSSPADHFKDFFYNSLSSITPFLNENNSIFPNESLFDFSTIQQESNCQMSNTGKCLNCGKQSEMNGSCMLLPCRHSGYCLCCANEMANAGEHCRLCGTGITQAIRF